MKIAMGGVIMAALTCGAFAQQTNVTIMDGSTSALTLAVPAGSTVAVRHGKSTVVSSNMYLHIWRVPGAATAAAALPRVAETIKGDVLKFSAASTNALTVAGAPAFHLIGKGEEADDGDDSTADIVVFAAGNRAFVACVHGEHNDASIERQPMLDALKTVRGPVLVLIQD